jgi:hypothetical protein
VRATISKSSGWNGSGGSLLYSGELFLSNPIRVLMVAAYQNDDSGNNIFFVFWLSD